MRIHEIFYSLQGEGYHVGTPAVFIRLAGCNLRCPFCDTDHEQGEEMTEEEIVKRVQEFPARHVILTGGEPSLQLTESLITRLHEADKYVAIETNGTHPLPLGIDWITLSPKSPFLTQSAARPILKQCDEMKLVYTGADFSTYSQFPDIQVKHYFLQPCDTGDPTRNKALLQEAIAYCLKHPQWRLSLQTHKMIGIE